MLLDARMKEITTSTNQIVIDSREPKLLFGTYKTSLFLSVYVLESQVKCIFCFKYLLGENYLSPLKSNLTILVAFLLSLIILFKNIDDYLGHGCGAAGIVVASKPCYISGCNLVVKKTKNKLNLHQDRKIVRSCLKIAFKITEFLRVAM